MVCLVGRYLGRRHWWPSGDEGVDVREETRFREIIRAAPPCLIIGLHGTRLGIRIQSREIQRNPREIDTRDYQLRIKTPENF